MEKFYFHPYPPVTLFSKQIELNLPFYLLKVNKWSQLKEKGETKCAMAFVSPVLSTYSDVSIPLPAHHSYLIHH
jgi:hypothetical protein